MKTAGWKKLVVLFLAGMAVAHAFVLWELRDYIAEGSSDFATFYTAGKLVQRGRASEMYSVPAQWELQQEFAPNVKSRRGALRWVHLPFEALPFLPFAYLSYPVAFWLWLAVKVCILFAIALVLRPYVVGGPPLPAAAAAALSLGTFPIAADLVQGQDAILLTLCFALAFAALRGRREFRSGVFLALGLFKFHLVIPLVLVLLLKRRWKVVGGFLATAVMLFCVSVSLVGWAALIQYPRYLWDLNVLPNAGVPTADLMPNLRALTTGLLAGSGAQAHAIAFILAIGIAGVVLSAAVWRSDDDERITSAGFSLCLVMTILTSYYAYSQDMSILFLPVWVLGSTFLNGRDVPAVSRNMFLAGTGLLLFSPLLWFLVLRSSEFHWVALAILLLLGASLGLAARKWSAQLAGS